MEENNGIFAVDFEQTAYVKRIPIRGTFELTARCNFDCNMCYIHLKDSEVSKVGRELTTEEWIKIAKEARDSGLLFLTLTGGEVFRRKDFKDLYKAFHEMGFVIQIFSNGYLINEEVLSWLSEVPPVALRFTLYGMSDETYYRVCGVRDGYTRVVRAIDLVREAGIPLYLVGTITNDNVCDLESMIQFSREKGISFRYSTELVSPVRGARGEVDSKRVPLDIQIPEGNRVERLYPVQGSILETCGSYRKGFWVTWDGRLEMCSLLEEPAVPLLEKSFSDCWRELNSRLDLLVMPSECNNCSYEGFCIRCPGLMYSVIKEDGNLKRYCKKAKDLKRLLGV